MWQMFHDKIQSADQLIKTNLKADKHYQLCGKVEDLNHIMFRCVSNRFV
jgi:hypothetical protein